MQIEVINIGQQIDVYNRHGERKGRGIVVAHHAPNYSHVIRMTEVDTSLYPYNYEVGGEYTYDAPSLSHKNHLRGGERSVVAVVDEPFDMENPF